MLDDLEIAAARAALEWQIELGATEAIGDLARPRWEEPRPAPMAETRQAPSAPTTTSGPTASGPATSGPTASEPADAVAAAEAAAGAAGSLEALATAVAVYPYCELKKGARSTVFADGRPGARVMLVGEAPGREEDIAGRPFVGAAGKLLDRMFGAIGLSRTAPDAEHALYIANVLPWRPPHNRDPSPDEIAMMMPFLRRHIALAGPDVLVCLGNTSCLALTGRRGILRLRGGWTEFEGRPLLPMCHPAYLLRKPEAKRDAWADLLSLQERLEA